MAPSGASTRSIAWVRTARQSTRSSAIRTGSATRSCRPVRRALARGLTGRGRPIPKERFHTIVDLVANAAERCQALLVAALDSGGVLEAPVNPLGACRKHRAGVARVIANGDHVVDRLA